MPLMKERSDRSSSLGADFVTVLFVCGLIYGGWLVALTLWKLVWKVVAFAWS